LIRQKATSSHGTNSGTVVALGGTTNAAAQNLVLKAIALANKGDREDLADRAITLGWRTLQQEALRARMVSAPLTSFVGHR